MELMGIFFKIIRNFIYFTMSNQLPANGQLLIIQDTSEGFLQTVKNVHV